MRFFQNPIDCQSPFVLFLFFFLGIMKWRPLNYELIFSLEVLLYGHISFIFCLTSYLRILFVIKIIEEQILFFWGIINFHIFFFHWSGEELVLQFLLHRLLGMQMIFGYLLNWIWETFIFEFFLRLKYKIKYKACGPVRLSVG